MTFHEWSDNFRRSFPGGRFKDYKNLDGSVIAFTDLKINKDAPAIADALVVYNQGDTRETWVIDNNNGVCIKIIPLSPSDYAAWKEAQRDD